MRKAEIITAVVLGLLSIYIMWKSGEGPAWNPDVARFENIWLVEGEAPGSGFWPFWLSLIMLLCCIWIGVNWWLRKSPQSQSDARFMDDHARKMIVLVGGGLIGFLAAIEFLGFYAGMFLFLVYYLRFLGRRPVLETALISVGMPVVSFFFFDVAMRIVLPKGLTEPLFIPLYDIFL